MTSAFDGLTDAWQFERARFATERLLHIRSCSDSNARPARGHRAAQQAGESGYHSTMNVRHPLLSMLRRPAVRRLVRGAADWVDLQWSLTVNDLRAAGPRARGRLLDVGCGCLPYEQVFAPYVSEYVGLEVEATFSETAAAFNSRQPHVYYDGERIPFESGTFDTVLSIQVLEHTPDPQHLLGEMARVLRPGGLLILSVPFSFRLHEEPHDFYRFTPHALRHMCAKAGLDSIEVRAQGSLWSVLGHKLNSFLAFRVGDMAAISQALGKLTQEPERPASSRLFLLPAIVPAMVLISAAARVLDRAVPDATEALSYLVIARRKPDAMPESSQSNK
jgi:SAM-dependent methyltransferase